MLLESRKIAMKLVKLSGNVRQRCEAVEDVNNIDALVRRVLSMLIYV